MRLFFNKPMTVSITENVFKPPYGEFTWTEIDNIPVIDNGFFFSGLTWKIDGQTYRINWLVNSNVEHCKSQLANNWCLSREVLLRKVVSNITKSLSFEYPRTSTIDKAIGLATKTIKHFPAELNEQWLNDNGYKDYKTLITLAKLNNKDKKQLQESFLSLKKGNYKSFFNKVESNPLTELQQNACIINEENNLVIAGAGTGKTSTMVGRAGYLIESKQATADEILLLAFGKQAAAEMNLRLNMCLGHSDIQTNTFHSIGLKIISDVEGKTPTVSPLCLSNTEKQEWISTQFKYLCGIEQYASLVVQYIVKHFYGDTSWFDVSSKGEYFQYIKDNNLKTLKGELVQDIGDIKIANWLYTNDIEYTYKAKFQSINATSQKTNYKPSFYLPAHKVYIEHWQLNIDQQPPSFIDKEQYLNHIEWIRAIHKNNGSVLIETNHSDLQKKTLISSLSTQLKHYGISNTKPSLNSVLDKINKSGALTQIVDLLTQTLSSYKSVWLNKDSIKTNIKELNNRAQLDAFLRLLLPIFKLYQELLNANNEIDFDDMIGKACNYVKDGSYVSPYRFILVDEFQDISEPRAQLIKALKDSQQNSSLFCVGDDWQSIYRFTGSDISLTTKFEAFFGDSSISSLDKTFRFNNSINEVASRFVMKNPAQLSKTLTTHTQVDKPAVTLCDSECHSVTDILASISSKLSTNEGHIVYILSRYSYSLPTDQELHVYKQKFSNLNIKKATFHASKGMEADSVILLGLNSGLNGFPAVKATHPLLNALLPEQESFPYAEERRLFYVALTRAKHHVYLSASSKKKSMFITELLDDNYPIADFNIGQLDNLGEHHIEMPKTKLCEVCSTGTLIEKESKHGTFHGCSNYPLCVHTA